MKQVIAFAIVFAIVGTIAIVQSFAAPSGGKGHQTSGTGTLNLVMASDANSDGLPNYKDSVRFNVYSAATTEPHVKLQCSQYGSVVYNAQTGYYDSYAWPWTQTFSLYSGAWTSGGADCTATGYYFNGSKTVNFATLGFRVNP